MLVIIKNGPDTTEGNRAVKLARDLAADICLIQNGTYFAQKGKLEGFCGAVYVISEDAQMRGLKSENMDKGIKEIDYDELVDLMVKEDKVMGMF